jgi:hypothetical protein
MKKIILFLSVFSTFSISGVAQHNADANGVPPYIPESKPLYDSIVYLDSLLFDSYNTCKLEIFASLVDEDLEFYHDRGGLNTSKSEIVQSIKNNICGKVKRELLKGSIEVYPIPGYGAIEMGAHRFYNNQEKENGPSRFSKFVHVWHHHDGVWQVSRVISLH